MRGARSRDAPTATHAMIYICLRPTLDWNDEAAVRAQLKPKFRQKVATWDATFTIPYHVFRRRLRTIAELNLARVDGAGRATLAAAPPGALVVPVDDDDWFAPDLIGHLEAAHDPSVDGYRWRRYVLEPPPPRPRLLRLAVRRLRGEWTCGSNNYALVNRRELAPLALNHMHASRHFDAHPRRLRRLPRMLSVQNRNLSSQTALAWPRPTITPAELRAVFARYRSFYGSVTLPGELRWAEPYVAMLRELMDELRLR